MISPTKNRVILTPDAGEKMVSGIIVTNTNKKNGGTLRWGTVEAIGQIEDEHAEALVVVGARVLFNDYDGFTIADDRSERVVIPIHGIYAVDTPSGII